MSDHSQKIDELLKAAATKKWTKTAVLISKVFESEGFADLGLSGQDVAARLYILIDNGQLEAKGNMRRWRDSEVKLVGK